MTEENSKWMRSSLCPWRSHHTRVHPPQGWTSRSPHLIHWCSPGLRSQGPCWGLASPGVTLPRHPWVHLPPALGTGHPWPGAAPALAAGLVLLVLACLYLWQVTTGGQVTPGDGGVGCSGAGGQRASPTALPCVPELPVAPPGVWEGWGPAGLVQVRDWGVPSGTAVAGQCHGCRVCSWQCWVWVTCTGVTGAQGVMEVGVLRVLGAWAPGEEVLGAQECRLQGYRGCSKCRGTGEEGCSKALGAGCRGAGGNAVSGCRVQGYQGASPPSLRPYYDLRSPGLPMVRGCRE